MSNAMEQNYRKIADVHGVPWNAVHLVHYVVKSMPDSYLPPPAAQDPGEPYSAWHVCAATLAFCRHTYTDAPLESLRHFKLHASEDIGRLVQSLSEFDGGGVAPIPAANFAGLFTLDSIPADLLAARWCAPTRESAEGDKQKTSSLLRKHFAGFRLDSLVITRRAFPPHMQADLQLALDEALADRKRVRLLGLTQQHEEYSGVNFTALLVDNQHNVVHVGPLRYHEVDVGRAQTVPCLMNGFWLGRAEAGDIPYAIVKGSGPQFHPGSQMLFEIAVPATAEGRAFSERFVRDLERRVESSRCYRGKVLSFEKQTDYHGRGGGILVHELQPVRREDVILPPATLEILDRNLVDFVRLRPALARRGMNLKKGVLFYGPPGTGKTHTIQYLTRALPAHTTVLITAEQVGLLGEYMTLARLLQPSIVVLEDADLIARERERLQVCEEVMLNKLLNEMDGLRADSEIIFVLTTNRPEILEAALTARPGRIDQAIEFPLPDAESRARLARLYAGRQTLADGIVESVVKRTEGSSAAFIKELMRRATQYAIMRGEDSAIDAADIERVVDEMLFSGGALNRKILGAAHSPAE